MAPMALRGNHDDLRQDVIARSKTTPDLPGGDRRGQASHHAVHRREDASSGICYWPGLTKNYDSNAARAAMCPNLSEPVFQLRVSGPPQLPPGLRTDSSEGAATGPSGVGCGPPPAGWSTAVDRGPQGHRWPQSSAAAADIPGDSATLDELLSDGIDSSMLVHDDDDDDDDGSGDFCEPVTPDSGASASTGGAPSPSRIPLLRARRRGAGSRLPVLDRTFTVRRASGRGSSESPETPPSEAGGVRPSALPRQAGLGTPSAAAGTGRPRLLHLRAAGGRGAAHGTSEPPRPARQEAAAQPACRPPPPVLPAAERRPLLPSKPTVASVLRSSTIRQGLAAAAAAPPAGPPRSGGSQSSLGEAARPAGPARSLSMSRAGRVPPPPPPPLLPGTGRYAAIHAGRLGPAPATSPALPGGAAQRPLLPAPPSSAPPLLPSTLPSQAGTLGNGSSNGSDHTDHRAFLTASKKSSYTYADGFQSDSSDEDPNGITLSNTTRSKMKLLAKRNEMRKEMERTSQEGGEHHESEERSRKFKQLEKEYSTGSVESRLAPKRNGHLSTVPGRSFASPRRSPHPAPLRRAFSHERSQRVRRTSHANNMSPEKPPAAALLPSPRMKRASGSMQNLATKPKHHALPKSKTFGDELNKRTTPGSASTVFGDHLEKFGNPKAALEEAYRKLNSDDWEREVAGLTDLVRLFRHHPEVVSSDVKGVTASIVKQMKNLRSQVLRAAIQTCGEMFLHVGKTVEPNLEKIAAILLQKTSDTNKFIKADSNRSLDLMLDNVSLPRAVSVVTSEGLGHRNAQVRCTVARLLAAVVQRLGATASLSGQRDITDRLVPAVAQLVREGDLQTRMHAKSILQVWLQHPDLDKVLSKYLSGSVKRDVDKAIDNLKNESSMTGKPKDSAQNKRGFGSRVRLNRTM